MLCKVWPEKSFTLTFEPCWSSWPIFWSPTSSFCSSSLVICLINNAVDPTQPGPLRQLRHHNRSDEHDELFPCIHAGGPACQPTSRIFQRLVSPGEIINNGHFWKGFMLVLFQTRRPLHLLLSTPWMFSALKLFNQHAMPLVKRKMRWRSGCQTCLQPWEPPSCSICSNTNRNQTKILRAER